MKKAIKIVDELNYMLRERSLNDLVHDERFESLCRAIHQTGYCPVCRDLWKGDDGIYIQLRLEAS